MRPSRAPWWLYVIAASFIGFFALQIFNYIWGPESLGFDSDYSTGSMIVQKVSPKGAAVHGGLRNGDRIVAVDGIPIRGEKRSFDFYYRAGANFEPGRPILIEVERQGKPIEVTMILGRGSLRDLEWDDWERIGAAVFTFILALVIGVRRPYDPVARISACFLASMAVDMVFPIYGWASIWRHLPGALGLFLWPAFINRSLIGGLSLTFAIVFPRTLVRNRLVWISIWLPVAFVATLQFLVYLRLVYRPKETPTALDLINIDLKWSGLGLCYVLATLVVLGIQYRRLKDVNERRRMRVLFAGAMVCGLAISAMIALGLFARAWFTDPIFAALFTLYAAGPVAFAYAVLRHRVFDLGVILRRGLQYALARRLLVSAVPVLAAVFLADLLLHGDQPILAVFRARGWVYAVIAALAAVAYTQRQKWLDTLDRRFFHYDARRILREVVEEVHAAKTFEEEALRAGCKNIRSGLRARGVVHQARHPPGLPLPAGLPSAHWIFARLQRNGETVRSPVFRDFSARCSVSDDWGQDDFCSSSRYLSARGSG